MKKNPPSGPTAAIPVTPSANDKRHTPRIALNMPVDLKRLDIFEMAESASIGDLTPEGVFIATKKGFNPGTEIEISLTFPGDESSSKNATVTLKGEVVWSGAKLIEEERRKIDGIGVRFKEMDAETIEQVLSLYERLNTKMI